MPGADYENEPLFAEDALERMIAPITTDQGRTDIANAQRFVEMNGWQMRYCHAWKSWLVWTGTHWKRDDSGMAIWLAQEFAKSLWGETQDGDRATSQFAVKANCVRSIEAMLKLAQSHLAVAPGELDIDLFLFNCANGTIDLRTGRLQDHEPAHYITRLCPTAYDPAAQAPLWRRCMEEWLILPGHPGEPSRPDMQMIRYLWSFFGYCLTGDTREQVLLMLLGSGGNGKTRMVDTIAEVLGPDYCGMAPAGLLLAGKSDNAYAEAATVYGKRFLRSAESEQGRRLNEALIKQLTGGEPVTARGLYESFFEFRPCAKFVLYSNTRPVIKGRDLGIWRRVKLVEFHARFTGASDNQELGAELLQEAPGILTWLVRGCLNWQRHGLVEPCEVTRATNEYRSNSDAVATFISECCQVHSASRVSFREFFDALSTWCERVGAELPGRNEVGSALVDLGYERRSSHGGRTYHGLRLHPESAEELSANSGR